MEESRGRYWDDLPEAEGGPELLAGRWVVSRTEHGEVAFVPGLPFGFRDFTFIDGRCTITSEALDRPAGPVDLAIAFDQAATPRGFDLTTPKSERPWRCIYKLTRDGRLLLAFGEPEDARPTGFDPTRHRIMLFVCDRAAP
jgi:uncharacterized protein (TIGR03067 family)